MRWMCLFGLAACATAPVPVPAAPAAAGHAVFVPRLIERKVNIMTPAGGTLHDGRLMIELARPVNTAAVARPASADLLINSLHVFPATPNAPAVEVAYCIDESGHVISTMPEVPEARGWVFAPYFVGDKPVVACSYTTI